jgi:hypothetical protein
VASRRSVLVIACGALVREIRMVLAQLDDVDVTVDYLTAPLHNRPERIPDAVRAIVEARLGEFDHIMLGYADCGTGGHLDHLAAEFGLTRLPGAHCYEFFAGAQQFEALHEAEPGTFYLTDYLARHFDALVIGGLGLDRHPQLRDAYFGNYHRLCFLSQTEDPALLDAARRAAVRLQLEFIHQPTGLAPFALALRRSL